MKKMLSLILVLCLMSILSAAFAEEQAVYLALGDSISTGYGLAEGEKGFVDILTETNGYTLINRAVDGNTASEILAQMADPAVQAEILSADVITITCGGNDLMELLYQEIANAYNSVVPAAMAVTAENVPVIMSDSTHALNQPMLLAAQTVLSGNAELGIAPFAQSEAVQTALADFLKNMGTIFTGIRSVNPGAVIIVTTQYNPYASFTAPYADLATGMDAGALLLNKSISDYSMLAGYQVADVYAAFAASGENLCNAAMMPLNLDFHPNAAGHAVIAATIQTVLDAE